MTPLLLNSPLPILGSQFPLVLSPDLHSFQSEMGCATTYSRNNFQKSFRISIKHNLFFSSKFLEHPFVSLFLLLTNLCQLFLTCHYLRCCCLKLVDYDNTNEQVANSQLMRSLYYYRCSGGPCCPVRIPALFYIQ